MSFIIEDEEVYTNNIDPTTNSADLNFVQPQNMRRLKEVNEKLVDAKGFIQSMMRKELRYYSSNYHDTSIYTPTLQVSTKDEINIREHSALREKLCCWMYSVVDRIGYTRESAIIGMNLFDRYTATKDYVMNHDLVKLVSLTTLYIAIKNHERKSINPRKLCRIIRSQFSPEDVSAMELEILNALSWMINPPTTVQFIYYLILFLPNQVNSTLRQEIFETSRYMAELSVYDPFFQEVKPSEISLAAVLNSIGDSFSRHFVPAGCKETFFLTLFDEFNFHVGDIGLAKIRQRLSVLLNANSTTRSIKVEPDDVNMRYHHGNNKRISSDDGRMAPSSSLKKICRTITPDHDATTISPESVTEYIRMQE